MKKEKKIAHIIEHGFNKAFNKYFKGLIDEYNLLIMIGLNEENDKKYFDIFKNLILKNKNELGNRLKYFSLGNGKTIKNILKESKEKGTNIFELLGFSHNNNSLKSNNDYFQIGTIYFIGLGEEMIKNNEYYLLQKVISNIYKKI